MPFILAFAFSFRIQSFIWCYMEGLLEQIRSPTQMLWNREGQQKYLPRTSSVPYEGSYLRYIGQDCKAKCKINVFRFVPKKDSSLRTFTSVFNNSSHMLQNVRYPSCYPGNNICCKQFANSLFYWICLSCCGFIWGLKAGDLWCSSCRNILHGAFVPGRAGIPWGVWAFLELQSKSWHCWWVIIGVGGRHRIMCFAWTPSNPCSFLAFNQFWDWCVE